MQDKQAARIALMQQAKTSIRSMAQRSHVTITCALQPTTNRGCLRMTNPVRSGFQGLQAPHRASENDISRNLARARPRVTCRWHAGRWAKGLSVNTNIACPAREGVPLFCTWAAGGCGRRCHCQDQPCRTPAAAPAPLSLCTAPCAATFDRARYLIPRRTCPKSRSKVRPTPPPGPRHARNNPS